MSDEKMTPAVIAKQRQVLLKEMSPQTREIAQEFEGRIAKVGAGVVMFNYDLGARVAKVMEDEATYGNKAVEQLAAYLQNPGGKSNLYSLKQVATTFDRAFVAEHMQNLMPGGGSLAIGHWVELAKVEDQKKRNTLLAQTLREGWSVGSLQTEIQAGIRTRNTRQGGRRPAVPTSPIAGAQKLFSLAQQFNNYFPTCAKHVFDQIDEMTTDQASKPLIDKLEITLKQAEDMKVKADDVVDRLKTNLEHAKKALEEKYEKAEEGRTEMEEAGEPAKAKAKAKAKAPAKAPAKAAKKKVPAKKPVAAK